VDAPQRFITAGTHGRVQTTPGLWLPFEITDWAPFYVPVCRIALRRIASLVCSQTD